MHSARRKAEPGLALALAFCAGIGAAGCAASGGPEAPSPSPAEAAEPAPAAEAAPATEALDYRLYIVNESSDIVSRVVFTPGQGARVEREIPVGIMPASLDAPHGVVVSPDGEHYYVTLAHGTPDGWLWKLRTGSDSVVARTPLGRFPASVGIHPGGEFVFVVNFNLHGDMVPSDLSIVHAPSLTEVTRVTSCLMPHGSRLDASGTRHYHVCMHSDQLVELDVASLAISNRFSLTPDREGLLDTGDTGAGHTGHGSSAGRADRDLACGPTWVAPGRADRADRFVYVACNRADRVLEVDTEAWEVTRRWDLSPGPYNLEVSPDGRLLVVTLRGGQGIGVIDLERGEVAAELETTRPVTHGVAIGPESRYAFVSNESRGAVRGTMDVFDLERLERVASVELGLQPTGIDLWRVDRAEP